MNNNLIYNLPFLLFYIPLIGSILACLCSNKKVNIGITLTTIISLLFILGVIIVNYNDASTIYVNIHNNLSLIGGEFKINILNVYFAFMLIAMQFFIFINTNYEIGGKVISNGQQRKYYFATFLLNIFSCIGILFTSNICNYYIFLEIYVFTIYTLISNTKNKDNLILTLNTFNGNIVSSLIILLSIFGLVLYCNSTNILYIYQRLLTTNLTTQPVILLILVFYMCGIVLKFFTSNIYINVYENKNNTVIKNNFLSFLSIFTNIILGTYCLIFFSNYLFNLNSLFNGVLIKQIAVGLISLLMVVNFVLLMKKWTLTNIILKSLFFDILFVVLFTLLNNEFSIYLSFLLILEHSIINLSLFLITNVLNYKYGSSDLYKLRKEKSLRIATLFLLLMKFGLPFTIMHSFNQGYLSMVKIENLSISSVLMSTLYIPFIMTKIFYLFIFIKTLFAKTPEGVEIKKMEYSQRKVAILKYSLAATIIITLGYVFIIDKLKIFVGL